MRTPEEAARAAWAEDAHEIIPTDKELRDMKPQPDMAQLPIEYEPVTLRDHTRTAVELIAVVAGGLGIFFIAAVMQQVFGG